MYLEPDMTEDTLK